MTLKGGAVSNDPRLDRIWPGLESHFPSLAYDVLPRLTDEEVNVLRSYTWSVNHWLDQGQEGRCVEFALCHELLGRPSLVDPKLVEEILLHLRIYHPAQHQDVWTGCYLGPNCPIAPSPEQYEGTSVQAGSDVTRHLGFYDETLWALRFNDLLSYVGRRGPAVMGTDWTTGMFSPDGDGFIHATGNVEGGHAWLLYGINMRGGYGKGWNSWGQDWGQQGTFMISLEDLEMLFNRDAEAMLVSGRNRMVSLI